MLLLSEWLDVSILTYNNNCLIETYKSKQFKCESLRSLKTSYKACKDTLHLVCWSKMKSTDTLLPGMCP